MSCIPTPHAVLLAFFFFNDTATTEIYTLSLHDALPIFEQHAFAHRAVGVDAHARTEDATIDVAAREDRKSTRLNSSHSQISYAVFCLKKKNIHRKAYRLYVCLDYMGTTTDQKGDVHHDY